MKQSEEHHATPFLTSDLRWACGTIIFVRGLCLGNDTCARAFLQKLFEHPQGVQDIPAKSPGHPRFLPPKKRPKEDKLSREGTNFSTTTPLRGRPPPDQAVSGPNKLIFVLFFLLLECLELRRSRHVSLREATTDARKGAVWRRFKGQHD